MAYFLRNRMFTTSGNRNMITPLEVFTGNKPYLSLICVFGANVFHHVPKDNRIRKLSERSKTWILVGYSLGVSCRVLVYGGSGRQIIVSKEFRFDEWCKN